MSISVLISVALRPPSRQLMKCWGWVWELWVKEGLKRGLGWKRCGCFRFWDAPGMQKASGMQDLGGIWEYTESHQDFEVRRVAVGPRGASWGQAQEAAVSPRSTALHCL